MLLRKKKKYVGMPCVDVIYKKQKTAANFGLHQIIHFSHLKKKKYSILGVDFFACYFQPGSCPLLSFWIFLPMLHLFIYRERVLLNLLLPLFKSSASPPLRYVIIKS